MFWNRKKEKEKVFCRDCKFEMKLMCRHPKNLKGNAYQPSAMSTVFMYNDRNDCKLFEKKKVNCCG